MSKEMVDNQIERKRRVDLVVGIGLAAVLSFALSVTGDIIYNIFIGKNLVYTTSVGYWISGLVLIVISIESFLEFLIVDYRNDMNFRKSFWWRYFDYYDRVYWLNRAVMSIGLLLWLATKWSFAIIFAIFLFMSFGWIAITSWTLLIIFWQLVRYRFRKKQNTNTK